MGLEQDAVFERLVRMEAEGELVGNPEAIESLHEDLNLWRDTLIRMIQEIDREFSERKGNKIGTNREFAAWKAAHGEKKNALLIKFRDVKGLIKQKNTEHYESGPKDQNGILAAMLGEIRAVRKLLEKR